MQKIIKLFSLNLDKKTMLLIKICFNISSLICLIALILMLKFCTYFSSILILQSSILILRAGIITGIFPIMFAIIINTYKQKNN